MNILQVRKEDVDLVFPKVRVYLDKAARLSGGRFTLDEIYDNLRSNKLEQQLWVAFTDTEVVAAAVTEIIAYPRVKSVMGHFIGGKDLESWKQPIVDALADFGKSNGCDRIEFMGRRGWAKPLKQIGWKETYYHYEYSLEK